MATCAKCQGANDDDAAVCIYCGQTFKKRGWWKRVFDAWAGEQDLEHCKSGAELQEQGRFEEAIAEFNEAIRINPKLEWAYVSRAFSYSEMGQYDRALQDCDQAIRLDPELENAYILRASAYSEMGEFDKALQDFDQAIRLDPQSVDTYHNRALTYTSHGMDAEAEEDVKRAEELGEDTTELRDLIEEMKERRPE